MALFAIPAGVLGGRLYHLITSPDAYFGKNGHPINALKIWNGGLGIWGAIALGTLAAYWAFKRAKRSLPFSAFSDALAPGLLIAQGVGRFGNWFNGELFGQPTSLPWGLEIPLAKRPLGYEGFQTFHPTFLYEALWCFAGAALLLFLSRSVRTGSLFVIYVGYYCLGRMWIEALRIDTAHQILGLRVNIWVSALGILVSAALLRRVNRRQGK